MVQFYNSLFDSFFFPSFSIPSWSIPWLEIPADFRFDFVSRDGGPGIILPAIEKAPVKSRSSSRRGSMTRAIHRGSWIAGKRERHSWKEEWWTKKRNGIDRGLSMSPVIYHRGSIAVSGSSQLRCFSSSWKYRYACVRSLRRDRKRDHRKSPRWNGSVISASISHSFLLKRRQI